MAWPAAAVLINTHKKRHVARLQAVRGCTRFGDRRRTLLVIAHRIGAQCCLGPQPAGPALLLVDHSSLPIVLAAAAAGAAAAALLPALALLL